MPLVLSLKFYLIILNLTLENQRKPKEQVKPQLQLLNKHKLPLQLLKMMEKVQKLQLNLLKNLQLNQLLLKQPLLQLSQPHHQQNQQQVRLLHLLLQNQQERLLHLPQLVRNLQLRVDKNPNSKIKENHNRWSNPLKTNRLVNSVPDLTLNSTMKLSTSTTGKSVQC